MLITVVLPTFNRAHLISLCVDSLLLQTYQNWELIIVDDGSEDETATVIKRYTDARIRYIYQENAERSAARNNGIEHAKGEWICFLDSDDEYQPNHLRELAKFIEDIKPSPGLIATGITTQQEEAGKRKEFLNLNNHILQEIGSKFLIPSQVCVHRSILENVRFDVRFRLWEDTHLWLRIAAQYPVYQMEEYTVIQHIHEQGTVVQGMKKIRLIEVGQYISAVQDLRDNHVALFKGKLPENYFNHYIDSKYRMYLYQARQNRQIQVAHQIWFKACQHRPSLYLLTEFPKILLNFLNFGLHER
jgi:glycosyltransferase involved in cell wall biosynthesis